MLPEELENLLYRPRFEEWPGGDRDEACSMIARGIDQVNDSIRKNAYTIIVDFINDRFCFEGNGIGDR